MTIETTKAPPKTRPWFKCSVEGCDKKWRAYHGKVGCKCYDCDDKTPKEIKR